MLGSAVVLEIRGTVQAAGCDLRILEPGLLLEFTNEKHSTTSWPRACMVARRDEPVQLVVNLGTDEEVMYTSPTTDFGPLRVGDLIELHGRAEAALPGCSGLRRTPSCSSIDQQTERGGGDRSGGAGTCGAREAVSRTERLAARALVADDDRARHWLECRVQANVKTPWSGKVMPSRTAPLDQRLVAVPPRLRRTREDACA